MNARGRREDFERPSEVENLDVVKDVDADLAHAI